MQTDEEKITVVLIDGDELFTTRLSCFLAKNTIEAVVLTNPNFQNLEKHADAIFVIDFTTVPLSPEAFYTAVADKAETFKLILLQETVPAVLSKLSCKTCSTKSDLPTILAHINELNTGVASSSLFDLAFLLEQAAGNDEFVKKMKQAFKTNVLEKTQLIDQYILDDNVEGVQKSVHQLKPSILHLRITTLHPTIKALEQKSWETTKDDAFLKHTTHFVTTLRKVAEFF